MSRANSTTPRRAWLTFAVIAVLIVADVAAIALALNNTRPAAEVVTAGPIPAFGESGGATPSAAPSTDPTSTDPATQNPATQSPTAAVRATRIIAARDASTAWRLLTGGCPTARAAPQLTVDSGVTWTMTDATAATGLTAVQRILVTGATSASLIGRATNDCTPQLVTVASSGQEFANKPSELGSAWFLDLATPGAVHSPARTAPAPCAEVVALAPRSASIAAVLCSDHTVSVTKNGGATWSPPRLIDGSLTITASADGFVLAAVGSTAGSTTPVCTGIQILTLAADLQSTTATGCLPLAQLPQESVPGAGDVALSVAFSATTRAATLWVWAGATVMRSADGGLTWS